MDSTFGSSDALGVGVTSALTPSQVQGWAFNHDSPSGLQDAAAAAAAAGGLGLGVEIGRASCRERVCMLV